MDEEDRKLDEKRKNLLIEEKIYWLFFVVIFFAIISVAATGRCFVIIAISVFVMLFWRWKIIVNTSLLMNRLKDKVTSSLNEIITDFVFKPNDGISETLYKKSSSTYMYDKYNVKNFMSGKLEDYTNFQMCDLTLTKEYKGSNGDSYNDVIFTGLFGVLDSKEIHDYTIRIDPDVKNKYINRIVAKMKKFAGIKDIVRLENPEFERYFEVHSDNQLEARKILTMEFMEKLLILRKEINKEITIIYKYGKIFFFIRKGKLIDEKMLMKKGVCPETKKCTYDNIKLLIETMNLLH